MPLSTELPENLKALARRNALQVDHHSFNPDVYRLIEHTESALVEAEESRVIKAHVLQAAREKTEKEAKEELAHVVARKTASESKEFSNIHEIPKKQFPRLSATGKEI